MKTKTPKNPDIQYGKVDLLDPDEFKPENVRILISIKIPGDVLEGYRALAAERGTKYQTLMNDVLRDYLGKSEQKPLWSASQSDPQDVHEELQALHKRVERLERSTIGKRKK